MSDHLTSEVQPMLVDNVHAYMYSKELSSNNKIGYHKYDNATTFHGIDKRDLTKQFRKFVSKNWDDVDAAKRILSRKKMSGKPIVHWRNDYTAKRWRCTDFSIMGYGSFNIMFYCNPTRYQKLDYVKKGLIDINLDDRISLRSGDDQEGKNYLYTVFTNRSREDIEKENLDYLPDFHNMGIYATCDVFEIESGYHFDEVVDYNAPHEIMPMAIYSGVSILKIEINQDIWLSEPVSYDLMSSLSKFYGSYEGRILSIKNGIVKRNVHDSLRNQSMSVILDFGFKVGWLKLYAKTTNSIRIEGVFKKNDHILPRFGYTKLSSLLVDKLKDLFKEIVERSNVHDLVSDWCDNYNNEEASIDLNDGDTVDYLRKLIAMNLNYANYADNKDRKFWRNLMANPRLLRKNEIPSRYLFNGTWPILKAVRIDKEWRYVLKNVGIKDQIGLEKNHYDRKSN